ncbi:MAG: DUF116 domain-containing protein [Endomicrobium sp.]|jgi:hypothetical protein|nr:DUF116 domain-containing protein [Endomicrobium sp.]
MKLCKIPRKSEEQIYKAFTEKQNKSQQKKFAAVAFDKRVVFAPHCMRNTAVCIAQEKESYYICGECGGCSIDKISKLIKKFGYKGLFIVKGGRSLMKLANEDRPEAVVGIACYFEGELGFKAFKGTNISVQYVPLTKDGCSATDADIKEIETILSQKI